MINQKSLTLTGTVDTLPDLPVFTAVGEIIAIHDRLLERGGRVPVALSAAVEQLRQAVRLDPLPVPALMNVRVLDRGNPVTAVRTVTVPAVCPSCDGPRGRELVELHSWVHGISMTYDGWVNPCGHVDTNDAVLVEARRFNDIVRGA